MGVDPGLTRCGLSVIEGRGGRQVIALDVDVVRTPAAQLGEETQAKQADLGRGLQEAAKALAAYTEKTLPSLVALESALVVERRVLEAEQHFPRTESTVLVTGWVAGARAGGSGER